LIFHSLLVACGGDQAPEPTVIHGETMGTTYTVKLFRGRGGEAGETLQVAIDALLEEVNDQMSTYRPDSELSRFNASPTLEWFPVSDATARVAMEALETSRLSGGAFDVTVGPLVNLWGFGPQPRKAEEPSEQSLATAMDRVGYENLSVRETPPALRKRRADLYVDLSAIAKGFAVDAVAELLDGRGVESYLVEIGGELRARGLKQDGAPWAVAIERPSSGERAIEAVVGLEDLSIATSGDYRNYVEVDGKRLSHTINPRTGRPVAHTLASVSVVAPSAMRADALATAIMVLGPEAGYRLAVEESLAVLLTIKSKDGFVTRSTPVFQEILRR
jgi:thiamine biosynthesis lipoprotein